MNSSNLPQLGTSIARHRSHPLAKWDRLPARQSLETSISRHRSHPLRVQFVITSLPVGGAEVLLLNLIRKMDKSAFQPEVICLKEAGALGDEIAREVPLHAHQLRSKWDLAVLPRLSKLMRSRRVDAVITVGAGDKMFWGRIAAKAAAVPVICSALHSTGWPDGVGRLNRWLTCITSGFIACAKSHAEHLQKYEKFPPDRVFMIPNGVDTDRFRPNSSQRAWLRKELAIPETCQAVGIVAALREEKNHGQFIAAAEAVLLQRPNTHFILVGEGPERPRIEALVAAKNLQSKVHLLGNRSDTQNILAGLDVFCLTSRNEANPVSILEALACGIPVVSPDVGSIRETVIHQQTGLLTLALSGCQTAEAIIQVLKNPSQGQQMGKRGRQLVQDSWSLDEMVNGYEQLIIHLFNEHAAKHRLPSWNRPTQPDIVPNFGLGPLPACLAGTGV